MKYRLPMPLVYDRMVKKQYSLYKVFRKTNKNTYYSKDVIQEGLTSLKGTLIENLLICSISYENNTLKVLHS